MKKLFLLMAFLLSTAASAAITPGTLELRSSTTVSNLDYYLYVPTTGAVSGKKLFITVHGISINAQEHAQKFQSFAEARGVVLIAPVFNTTNWDDYQSFGTARADTALKTLIDEVQTLTRATGKVYLFGYSGGGQFVHRFAMAWPEEVAKVAVGAAGWYTWPWTTSGGNNVNWPMGMANPPTGVTFTKDNFLPVNMAVFVGENDTVRDSSLNTDAAIDSLEGLTRYERGKNWIEEMHDQVNVRNTIKASFMFQSMPGCAHSFGDCMDYAGMGDSVFNWLFGPL